ncbi:hypothetical protein CPC08DRAFT_649450 [Agrocybe pediades]|nr:hypothetical protein CPC08DRAFT_649450 [Agrocybe pediades]
MYQGHLPRLAVCLHDKKFIDSIGHVFVDEAHNIFTSGTKKHEQPPFRPAWGALDEVRARLPKATTWQALSATLPLHILKRVDENLSFPQTRRLLRLSINRRNISYAVHTLVNGIQDFHNLDCVIPQPFHPPMRLPKLLIVHDNKAEADKASSYLNSRLPLAFQSLGVCKHYHGDMSIEYLEETFNGFADPDGSTLILDGTAGAGTGIDVQGIDGVIQYGLCADVAETFQRGGRAGRDTLRDAFFVIMVEPWVADLDISSRTITR